MKKYSKAPAGKMWHHDFVGGLLEHVHSLIAISKTVHASHPDLDLDLLIAACILHDIGKTVEFDIGVNIEITDEGRLYGHISIGHKMVATQIEKISDFPKELERKILHIQSPMAHGKGRQLFLPAPLHSYPYPDLPDNLIRPVNGTS